MAKRGITPKKVYQYTEDGMRLIKLHISAVEASIEIKCPANAIRNACRTGKVYGGYIWRYSTRQNGRIKR